MCVRRVFVSSTARDLAEHREAVIDAIDRMDDFDCVCMERFGARDAEADPFCREVVTTCDVFVGIVGHLYGSCPEGSDVSFTRGEYEAAVQSDVPRLMFLAPEGFPVPANLLKRDTHPRLQEEFRQLVSTSRIRDTFTSPEDLARRVVTAIRNWESKQMADPEEGLEVVDEPPAWGDFIDQHGRRLRYIWLEVHNTSPTRALVCYVQLREILNLADGQVLPGPPVELTWSSYTSPDAPIPAGSRRKFDAVLVPHDNPQEALFQGFTTSALHAPWIDGPGAFELTYAVISDALPEVGVRCKLTLGSTLDEVAFTRIHE